MWRAIRTVARPIGSALARGSTLARASALAHGGRLALPCSLGCAYYVGSSAAQADAAPPSFDLNTVALASLPAVVSIKVNRVRAFDTINAGSIQGTGFVVDAERGYIMTNRHIAGPGPVVADAIFASNEEVPLKVLYYDPVHDFALFKFDPSAVKHMEVVQLELAPHEAELGAEVVVIGNNAGERSSIHTSTLARLDRNAPVYNKRDGFNDFNTFYFHSASSTTGGSSGSPVLNRHGHAIAINSGCKTGTTAAYFLPLDRAQRVLRLLQAGQPVTRGTLQAVCKHQPYDEARRLGLPETEEVAARVSDAGARGMLVVSETLSKGPADGKLEIGDIVLRIGGEPCLSFVRLEETLDSSVHGTVALDVCRGGVVRTVEMRVDDLHELTPNRYVEVGGGVLNELSYQLARNHGIRPRGVYVAHPGYMLRKARVTRGCIIDAINGVPTPDLDSFIKVLEAQRHGQEMTVRFFDISHRTHIKLASMTMDRKWFAPMVATRSDPRVELHTWTSSDLTGPESSNNLEVPDSATMEPDAPSSPPELPATAVSIEPPAPTLTEAASKSSPYVASVRAGSATEETRVVTVWQRNADGVWEGKEHVSRARRAPPAASASAATKSKPPAADTAATAAATATGGTSGDGAPEAPTPLPTLAPPKAAPAKAAPAKATPIKGGTKVNVVQKIAPALVSVDFTRPFSIDGETGMRYRGAGVVLDAAKGLVAVDRNTVTSTLGDVTVTVGDAATLDAHVLYVHPLHNFALVRYDPSALPSGLRVESATLDLPASRALTTGGSCWLIGLKSGLNEDFDASRRVDIISRKTRVANSGWFKLPLPNPPRYQLHNAETFGLEVAPSMDGGVIANADAALVALWTSNSYTASKGDGHVFRGLPVHQISAAVQAAAAGEPPPPYCSLGATFEPISTAAARRLGVSDTMLPARAGLSAAVRAAGVDDSGGNVQGSSVLSITHVQSNSPCYEQLRGGDLLVAVDGAAVTSLLDAEAALQGRESVEVSIVRDGQMQRVRCATMKSEGLGTTEVVCWAGLLLQTAPEAVQSQRTVPKGGGVYASYRYHGSPSVSYNISPTSHIVEVDSTPTPDLASFLACTRHKRDGEVLRVKYVTLEGHVRMTTLKLDLQYWPTFTLSRDAATGEWGRRML